LTELTFYAFLLVFLRCSAMFLTSPVFSAQNAPLMVRIFTGVSVSAALTTVVQPKIGPLPQSMWDLVGAAGKELMAGILIGSMVTLAMQALTIAGAIMDLTSGLGSSRVLNPLNGVESTVLSHLKSMLGLVIFLCIDAHHLLIRALVGSYNALPTFGAVEHGLLGVITQMSLLSLQIAAPVLAVGLIVDAALALLARAVPHLMAMQVGLPAKIGVGLATVALGLPITVLAVNTAVGSAFTTLHQLFHF
jgi:flagellar biosynthesis protein FliR